MLFLLSPAKTLDYESPLPDSLQPLLAQARSGAFTPEFSNEAAALIERLRTLSVAEVAGLMELSDDLARLNVQRFKTWSRRATEHNSRPALLAFNGDVYDGLQARSLDTASLAWAQQHLRILSGLYGLLRPLDRLQPYRLEMGRPLATDRGGHLYAWWGDTVAQALNGLQSRDAAPLIVNLASQEYFKVTQARSADGRGKCLRARVVECVFEDWNERVAGYKVISFHAKRARGLMARHAIDQRLDRPEGLDDFRSDGYALDLSASTPDRRVFRRRLAGA